MFCRQVAAANTGNRRSVLDREHHSHVRRRRFTSHAIAGVTASNRRLNGICLRAATSSRVHVQRVAPPWGKPRRMTRTTRRAPIIYDMATLERTKWSEYCDPSAPLDCSSYECNRGEFPPSTSLQQPITGHHSLRKPHLAASLHRKKNSPTQRISMPLDLWQLFTERRIESGTAESFPSGERSVEETA